MTDELIQFAEKSITAYLAASPGSADTIEGIHRWWIHWSGPEPLFTVTEAALSNLQQAEKITQVQIGNRQLWRLPR